MLEVADKVTTNIQITHVAQPATPIQRLHQIVADKAGVTVTTIIFWFSPLRRVYRR